MAILAVKFIKGFTVKKTTRIQSDSGNGAASLVQVEAVAVRQESYRGGEITKTQYDIVTVTVTSATVSTTHTFHGSDGGYGGFGKTFLPGILPLPLQEDEKFGQAVRDLMNAMVDVHINDIKQFAEILPAAKEKGQLKLTSFEAVSE
jgi:hypothetical protein